MALAGSHTFTLLEKAHSDIRLIKSGRTRWQPSQKSQVWGPAVASSRCQKAARAWSPAIKPAGQSALPGLTFAYHCEPHIMILYTLDAQWTLRPDSR